MGVRMEESGDRRWRRSSSVIEYANIPRYGLASPFKGHLSTTSNAFCIDSSSRRLSNQYLIRDHMAVHYNKILSAKAAVDCSLPKSRVNSIKFSDQQRREKLKKEVEKCEKEMISSKNVSRPSSRESRRLLSATYRKDSLEPEGIPYEQQSVLGSQSTPERQSIILQSLEKSAKKASQKISSTSVGSSGSSSSSLQRLHSKISYSSSSDITANKHSHKTQNPEPKVCSGDLLEKHSEHFTNGQQPFTPRTLKSDAKSFLSQYRYYTPARRKVRDNLKHHLEAETQTDTCSFQTEFEGSEKRDMPDFQKIVKEAEDTLPSNTEKTDEMKAVSQFSLPRAISPCSDQSTTMRRIQAEEEELLYLNFIQDITDEILKLGLFSNRALDMLFERHIEQNKNLLDEKKMCHLLEILKVDLGCSKEEFVGASDAYSLQENEQAKHLQLPSKDQSNLLEILKEDLGCSKEESIGASDAYSLQQNEQEEHLQLPNKDQSKVSESEHCLTTLDLIASDSAARTDTFQKVEDQDDISEDIKELLNDELNLPSFVMNDETLDPSCTMPPACNSTTCDSDIEISEYLREVDELKESMAECLSISVDSA